MTLCLLLALVPVPVLAAEGCTHVCGPECVRLTCGLEESAGHTHTDDCYTEACQHVCDAACGGLDAEEEPPTPTCTLCGEAHETEDCPHFSVNLLDGEVEPPTETTAHTHCICGGSLEIDEHTGHTDVEFVDVGNITDLRKAIDENKNVHLTKSKRQT